MSRTDHLGAISRWLTCQLNQRLPHADLLVGLEDQIAMRARGIRFEGRRAIARHVAKRGEGMQHVAYRVDNIEQALQDMRAKGIALIDERPRPGARKARVAFLHPKSTKGVLIEFVEPQSSPLP